MPGKEDRKYKYHYKEMHSLGCLPILIIIVSIGMFLWVYFVDKVVYWYFLIPAGFFGAILIVIYTLQDEGTGTDSRMEFYLHKISRWMVIGSYIVVVPVLAIMLYFHLTDTWTNLGDIGQLKIIGVIIIALLIAILCAVVSKKNTER